jgi:hypothetical protein
MLNFKLNAQGGFTPAAVAPPMRYLPGRCRVIIAQRRGGMGEQAHVPSLIRTRILNFISMKRNSTEQENRFIQV